MTERPAKPPAPARRGEPSVSAHSRSKGASGERELSPSFRWLVQQARAMGLGVEALPDATVVVEGIPLRLIRKKVTGEQFVAVDPTRMLWLLQIFLRMKTLDAASTGREAEIDAILNRPRNRREIN